MFLSVSLFSTCMSVQPYVKLALLLIFSQSLMLHLRASPLPFGNAVSGIFSVFLRNCEGGGGLNVRSAHYIGYYDKH